MKRKIRWGILGLGKIAEKFAEDLRLVPDAELFAVASRAQEKANSFGHKFGVKHCYGDYESLARNKDLDVVYIATPHTYHCENTILCLENGKATLCEKPFGMNLQEVQKMISLADEKDVFLMEALWTRFIPSFRKALEIYKDGIIGEIHSIHADFGFKAPFLPEGRLFNKKLGGGALMDVGIYPVFLAYSFLGMPEKIEAEAFFGKTNVDENDLITLHYPNGVYAKLDASIKANTPVEAHINGTEGRITIHTRWHEPSNLTLHTAKTESKGIKFVRKSNGYNYEAEEVTKLLLDGKKQSQLMSHTDSINLITLLDSIRERAGIYY